MRKIYSILFITILINIAFAQDSTKKFTFLVKGGINISNYATSKPKINVIVNSYEYKNIVGLNFSAATNFKLSNSLALQMGLGFSQKGNIYQPRIEITAEDGSPLGYLSFKIKQRITYLEIPLNVVYNYKKLSFGLGPYLAYTIAAKSFFDTGNTPYQASAKKHLI